MCDQNGSPIVVGQELGPYRIEAFLGAGGMGVVYRARDRGRHRTVAIKVVDRSRSSERASRSLLEEARIAAALNHPSICGVHQVGVVGNLPFIVMEHIDGCTLSTVLQTAKVLALNVALCYASQIVDAVAYAHGADIVHGDLKSSNIMIDTGGRPKILDFGLAVRQPPVAEGRAGDTTTRSLDVASGAGTVPYMAPELLRGRSADRRSDIWALGVLFYEMVAGRRPFRGATRYELAAAILYEQPLALPPEVPGPLRTVISQCLLKHAGDRYRCAGELASALHATTMEHA